MRISISLSSAVIRRFETRADHETPHGFVGLLRCGSGYSAGWGRRRRRPVAANCLYVVWMRPSGRRAGEAVDGPCSRVDFAVAEQRRQERVRVRVERLQRVGVGGVAGLGALGLRDARACRKHACSCLGDPRLISWPTRRRPLRPRFTRPQSDSSARGGRCRRRCRSLLRDSTRTSGSSTRAAARCRPLASSSASTASASVRDGPGAEGVGLGRRGLVLAPSKVSWPSTADPGPQLALEVAQRQVGQVEPALVGHGEVRRQRRVPGDPATSQPRAARGRARALGVVEGPGPGGSASQARRPGPPRGEVGPSGTRAVASVAASRPRSRRRCHRPSAADVEASRVRRAGVPQSGRPTLTGPRRCRSTSKPWSASGSAEDRVSQSRSRRTRNCRASKTLWTSSRSHFCRTRSCGLTSIGTSRTNSVSRRFMITFARSSRARRRPCP